MTDEEEYHEAVATAETVVGSDGAARGSSGQTTAYNGFAEVDSPEQYLNAPKTINITGNHPPYTMDISNQSFFDLSPMLNVQDPVSLHFLVQNAIGESKGFKILSYQELDDAKKEFTMLYSRVTDVSHKLTMEKKLKDAASSLSKLHMDQGSSNTSQSQKHGSTSSNGSAGRRSFLFGSQKKRLSRHAEEEAEIANRKIQTLEEEYNKLNDRFHTVHTKILKHNIGILALTHQGSQSSSSRTYEGHLGDANTVSGIAATERMMNQRDSLTSRDNNSRDAVVRSSDSEETLDNSSTVDSLITLVSSSLASPTTSPRHPPPNEKLSFLSNLSQSLVSQYDSTKTQLAVKEQQCEELKQILNDALCELDPELYQKDPNLLDTRDLSQVRAQTIDAVSNTKRSEARVSSSSSNSNNNNGGESSGKTLMRQQLESLTASYETNRKELEKLELENVELTANLRDTRFKSQAEIQELQHELKANQERVQEWQERSETLKNELESVVKTLEDLTRQTVEYESERTKLESKVQELEAKLQESSKNDLDKKVSGMGTTTRALNRENLNEPVSVTILRQEFKKIITELTNKHQAELKQEQGEKKKLENLLKSIKTSSYAANLPPEKLESLTTGN